MTTEDNDAAPGLGTYALLKAELKRRERITTRAALRSESYMVTVHGSEVAQEALDDFTDLHTPADALYRYEAAHRVLERHTPPLSVPKHDPGPYSCTVCSYRDDQEPSRSRWVSWPCEEIRDLAASLRVDITE